MSNGQKFKNGNWGPDIEEELQTGKEEEIAIIVEAEAQIGAGKIRKKTSIAEIDRKESSARHLKTFLTVEATPYQPGAKN